MSYDLKRTDFFVRNIKKYKKDTGLMRILFKKIKKIRKNTQIGKNLKKELAEYKSTRIGGKFRLIFKVNNKELTLVAFGPRRLIYDYIILELRRSAKIKSSTQNSPKTS